MRAMLSCLAILGLAISASAAPKEDKKKPGKDDNATKLVGKWAPVAANKKLATNLMEVFTKDGKYTMGDPKLKEGLVEGTYKVEGDVVTITKKIDKEGTATSTQQRTIKKITDTEIEFSFGGKIVHYKRLK